jgi:ectoine hydroxylase-related dioxygenase (phytanoyl-CoA dioxygenase family)
MIPSMIRQRQLLWICTSLLCSSASSAFLSNELVASTTTTRRRLDNNNNNGPLQSSKQQHEQQQQTEDLHGILNSMGLTPAVAKISHPPKAVVAKGKPSSQQQQQQQQQQPTKKKKKKKSSKGIIAPTKSKSTTSTTSSRIGLKTQLDYARNGHAVLKNFVDPIQLKQIRKQVLQLAAKEELKAWRQKVQVASDSADLASSCRTVQECQDRLESLGITASLPFLQYFNMWRRMESIEGLAHSLGEAASVLLDVPTVRLYQDSLFWKRTGDGPTPWHVDARMAPFDTSHFITFWFPLEPVPADGTGLLFCSKSHSDVALPYWNSHVGDGDGDSGWDRLENRYPKRIADYMPLQVGDVTVHSGWTLHSSNGNEHGKDRVALAISFVDAKAEVRQDASGDDSKNIGDNEDQWSYQDWVHEVPVRKPFKHHDLVPIVWPRKV